MTQTAVTRTSNGREPTSPPTALDPIRPRGLRALTFPHQPRHATLARPPYDIPAQTAVIPPTNHGAASPLTDTWDQHPLRSRASATSRSLSRCGAYERRAINLGSSTRPA